MCGISGFFHRDRARSVDRAVLDRMTDIMAHRGPDDRGTFVERGGALGHRRLSILDLSAGGRQPMLSADGKAVLCFNGEIYDYKELAATYLASHSFRTTSDTEVLLELLRRQGLDAIPRLNGMFAFAYWDLAERKVYFARDPVGQKPLFFFHDAKTFVFGSELASVAMHPDVPLEIDSHALDDYLAFEGYPHPRSALKGVRKLRPGHYMVLDLERWELTEGRYWFSTPSAAAGDGRSEREVVAAFEAHLKGAIERHYRSDVPVGIFLSAGLDSNSIVRAAVELKGPDAIQTFTIRHAEKSFDEADEAKETATFYGVRHHERLLTEGEMLSNVQLLLDALDEPLADPGYISISQVIRFAKEHVTVTLGGDGGDEYFAGYAPFRALKAYRLANLLLSKRSAQMLERLASVPKASHAYMNSAFKVQRFLRGVAADPSEVLMRWIGAFTPEEIGQLRRSAAADHVYDDLAPEVARLEDKELPTVLLHLFQQFYLPVAICAHSDKASMAVSQELRSPFLDVEMLKFANALPTRFKFRNGDTKVLLRLYHQSGSPPNVAWRAKRGFTVPIARWLTTTLRPWAEELLSPKAIEEHGFFDAAHVRRLWDEHQSLRANHAKALWTLLVFQNWYRHTFSKWKASR